ncbi:MAG: SLBB domain-containing protein [bacterium]|nr:SLBB domain-containing protein [bacterium]
METFLRFHWSMISKMRMILFSVILMSVQSLPSFVAEAQETGTPPPILKEMESLGRPEEGALEETARTLRKEVAKPEETKPKEVAITEEAPSEIETLLSGQIPSTVSTRLKQFGYDLFKSTVSTFAPITDVPVGPDYIIGPGDSFTIVIWGRVNVTYEVTVDRNGEITLPELGALKVWGLTLKELKDYLQHEFSRRYTKFEMNITMGRLRTIRVFVVGEAVTPGSYSLSSLSTLFNALFAAGGPSKRGTLRNIHLIRDNKTIKTVDLYDFLLKGDKSQDVRLQNEDTIFIPMIGDVVGVAGNVRRPAIYEMKKPLNLKEAIDLAGGITPAGYLKRIQVERIVAHEYRIVVDFNLSGLLERQEIPQLKTILQDMDMVKIFPILPLTQNIVYLEGHVERPGGYELKKGMRISDLIPGFDDLLPEPYLDYAEVIRLEEPDLHPRILPFNLGEVLKGNLKEDLPIQRFDRIKIYPKEYFVEKRLVSIIGEVKHPGIYKLVEKMRISDLIHQAGDLTKDAYLDRAELFRITPLDPDMDYRIIPLNLKKILEEDPEQNLYLEPKDRFRVYSKWDLLDKPFVIIEGEVRKPGKFELVKDMRISDLIHQAGDLTKDAYLEQGEIFRLTSDRKIETIYFNIEKALNNEDGEDILLMDEDRVAIHNLWEKRFKETVSIMGLVNKPGDYRLTEGMRVSDLIFQAGSLMKNAYLREAELIRRTVTQEGMETKKISINLEKALQGDPTQNLLLEDYDYLVIRQIPELDFERIVNISGEVMFPGSYLIEKGDTLSSLIERSGGYTKRAYLRGAVFTRESVRILQEKRINDLIKEMEEEILTEESYLATSTLSPDELKRRQQSLASRRGLIAKLKAAQVEGRLVIGLLPLKKLKGSKYDIELEKGDSLFIPERPNEVTVMGEVYNPTSLIYEEGKNVKHYLKMVGGVTRDADKDQIFVIRADGSVISRTQRRYLWPLRLFSDRFMETRLYPGDTILVSKKITEGKGWERIKESVHLLYQIAVSAGVIKTLF